MRDSSTEAVRCISRDKLGTKGIIHLPYTDWIYDIASRANSISASTAYVHQMFAFHSIVFTYTILEYSVITILMVVKLPFMVTRPGIEPLPFDNLPSK